MNNAPHPAQACNVCGEAPVGEACYHLCPNSVHFYSPEQERADDAFYGDDDIRERYAAEAIPADWDDAWNAEDDDCGEYAAAIADEGGADLPF